MNLPNKLTILRAILVPVFIACLLYIPNAIICGLVSAAVFGITAFTDFLDGKIARERKLVTKFGKFMDPLADKFMVFCALLAITVKMFQYGITIMGHVMVWSCAIVFLRELGVTSLRMVAAKEGEAPIAANFFGKAKTVTQIIAIVAILLEFAVVIGIGFNTYFILSYVAIGVMLFMTVASGINYLKIYGKHIDPNE